MWVDVEYDLEAGGFVAKTDDGRQWLLRSRNWQGAVVEAEMQVDDRELLMDDV